MSSLLFYEKPVVLNREQHRTARIGSLASFSFAAKTNSVVLAAAEFVEACKEYPIVFAQIGDRMVPVALLGLRENENLFVNKSGAWHGRYVPAFVRRYPFVLAETGAEELAVCVDESSPAFNAEGGELLFDEAGDNTLFLNQTLEFLNAYQVQFKRTTSFVTHLTQLNVLTELSAKAELVDGRNFLLNGLWVVDEQKLQRLDRTKAHALLKAGELGWIYAHLISLSNMSRLIDRLVENG
jgi:hypothetical protein